MQANEATLLKYFSNGKFVANVEFSQKDFIPRSGQLCIGEAFDQTGKRWNFSGPIFMVLIHNVCLQPNFVQEMSRAVFADLSSWGTARTGDGSLMGALIESEVQVWFVTC